MRKSRWERLPLEKGVLEQLSDKAIPEIDRVALADPYRQSHSYPISDVAAFIGITEAAYIQYNKLLHSNNVALLDEVRKSNCSMRQAMYMLENNIQPDSSYWENCFRYAHIWRIRRLNNVEILFESNKNILYRTDEGVYLGITCGDDEKCCVIDDNPVIITAIIALLTHNKIVRWETEDFTVYGEDRKRCGNLKHHIVSAITNNPYDEVIKATVSYKREAYNGVYDLRVSNLTCPFLTRHVHPDACGGFVVTAKGKNEILIIDESRGDVYRTDYSEWLYIFLKEKRHVLRLQAKDNRLCVSVGGRLEYIYHVAMAANLYGTPATEADLSEKLRQFRQEYLDCGNIVDHLDTNVKNNSLSNLMVMTVAQNNRKAQSQKIIKNLGLPVFCWAKRYDNTGIKMEAGYVHQLSSPDYKVRGVFCVNEYLDELDKFAVAAENDGYVCGNFD